MNYTFFLFSAFQHCMLCRIFPTNQLQLKIKKKPYTLLKILQTPLFGLYVHNLYLRQVSVLHNLDSSSVFIQRGPIFQLQVLSLFCVPPSHVTEHAPHEPHVFHVVKTEIRMKRCLKKHELPSMLNMVIRYTYDKFHYCTPWILVPLPYKGVLPQNHTFFFCSVFHHYMLRNMLPTNSMCSTQSQLKLQVKY